MKNKATLALMELVIMLLVFALASALCLKAFVWSHHQSEMLTRRDDAVLAVQNGAELIKSSKGDAAVIEALNGSDFSGFRLHAEELDVNTQGLGTAVVTAAGEDGEEIFRLQVYWQKPLEGGSSHG